LGVEKDGWELICKIQSGRGCRREEGEEIKQRRRRKEEEI
jgi:hypothetical protein